jgi:hypothetical protein
MNPKFAQQNYQAPCNSGSSQENMFRVVTAAQHIVTAVYTADSEEEKIMTISKIAMTIMNLNSHWSSSPQSS